VLEQVPDRTSDPTGDPQWNNLFLKNCSLWNGPTLEKFVENCLPWREPTLKQGKNVRRRDWEKQCVMNLLQAPFPNPLH